MVLQKKTAFYIDTPGLSRRSDFFILAVRRSNVKTPTIQVISHSSFVVAAKMSQLRLYLLNSQWVHKKILISAFRWFSKVAIVHELPGMSIPQLFDI